MTADTLKPCPFCGGEANLVAVGRDWWRITANHDDQCMLLDAEYDVPQSADQREYLIRDWNTRAVLSASAGEKKDAECLSINFNLLSKGFPEFKHEQYGTFGSDPCVLIAEDGSFAHRRLTAVGWQKEGIEQGFITDWKYSVFGFDKKVFAWAPVTDVIAAIAASKSNQQDAQEKGKE